MVPSDTSAGTENLLPNECLDPDDGKSKYTRNHPFHSPHLGDLKTCSTDKGKEKREIAR